jgi:hypothetical protein
MNRICAIHQPNFFPWLGYFDKIVRCDKFIILDDVQFPKKGGTWMNRVPIRNNDIKDWMTAPIIRKSGLWSVRETYFQNSNWRQKIWSRLKHQYNKSPFFHTLDDFLKDLIFHPSNNLTDYNINNLLKTCKHLSLNISEKFILQSDLKVDGDSNELLINLTKAAGCNTYLCGMGASGYQNDDLFAKKSLQLIFQDFNHPIYNQANSNGFIKGLSILDCLFNIGTDQTSILLHNIRD